MSGDIRVYENDIEKALRALKRQLLREGVLKEISKRRFYEKPSDRKRRKREESRKKISQAHRFNKSTKDPDKGMTKQQPIDSSAQEARISKSMAKIQKVQC